MDRLSKERIAYLKERTYVWTSMPDRDPKVMSTSALLVEFHDLMFRWRGRSHYSSPDNTTYNDLVLWRIEQVSDEIDRRIGIP